MDSLDRAAICVLQKTDVLELWSRFSYTGANRLWAECAKAELARREYIKISTDGIDPTLNFKELLEVL